MNIGMQTWGSHGDVRPMLALAEGLQAAGHWVTLHICGVDRTDYRTMSAAHGVRLIVTDSPLTSAEQGRQILETAYRGRDPLKQLRTIMRLLYEPVEHSMLAVASQLAADNDLLIGHYFVPVLHSAAAQAGKPYVSVVLSDPGIPTAYAPPTGMPDLGRTCNRLSWWLARTLMNKILRPYSNRLRQRLGLPPLDDILTQGWLSTPLTLLAVSPQLSMAPPDWPASVKTCGFFDLPHFAPDGALPAELADFLQGGEAPVYMTFGSWMPSDSDSQRATLALLTDAASAADCRAIIQAPGWAACGFRSSRQILYVSAAPHAAIFPRCSAIVHHGGAGTTGAATAAGRPSIVVAHLSEQEHWGRALQRLGVAGKPLHRRTLSAKALAQAITRVVRQREMRVKALLAGEAMGRENGVADAVKLIEYTFGRSGERPQTMNQECA